MLQFYRKLFRVFIVPAIFLTISLSAKAQTADSLNFKHVRLDVARMGLHCPILGPKLVQKLKEVQSSQNVKLYVNESYITFELPSASNVAEGQIKDIAVKVGYPAQDVKVTMDH